MAKGPTAEVIGQLRAQTIEFKNSTIYNKIVKPRDQVIARFQPVFSIAHISELSADEFKSFLIFENNRHWTGLQRQGTRMCLDMTKLRHALSTLLSEELPLAQRLDDAVEEVCGMGKNIASAILLVAHPDKYGVWNNRSYSATIWVRTARQSG